MRSLLWVSILSAALAGCVADAGVSGQATFVAPPPPPPQPIEATVSVQTEQAPPPDYQATEEVDEPYVEPSAMVYVNSDVQVIEDYDYPVFYSTGLYWRYDGGTWYSSSYHDRGWNESREVPVTIRRIDRPTAYVHYRGEVNARPGQAGYRNTHIVAPTRPAGPPPHRTQPGQVYRAPTRTETREPVRSAPTRTERPEPTPVHNAPTRTESPPPAHTQAYDAGHPAPTRAAPTHTESPKPAPYRAPAPAPTPAKKKK